MHRTYKMRAYTGQILNHGYVLRTKVVCRTYTTAYRAAGIMSKVYAIRHKSN